VQRFMTTGTTGRGMDRNRVPALATEALARAAGYWDFAT
jgi:hypothetical protein